MHTVQNYIIAAHERLVDARTLLAAGRYDSACYLAGFAIEMALKHAAMTAAGAAPTDSSDRWRSYFWTTFARQRAVAADYQAGHGIRFWAAVLAEVRNRGNLGQLAAWRQTRLNTVVQATTRWWSVDMRYDVPSRTANAANELLSAAGWVANNHMRLTRKRGSKCR